MISEAAERGVKVSDAEVKKQFNQIKSQQFPTEAAFQKFLTSTGYTVSDVLLRVKLDLLSTKLQQKISKEAGAKPTQKEIQSYYEQHKSQYGQPEKRNILIILTKTQAQAEKAKKEIESGKSFASVAKADSIDPVSKAAGGSLPGVVKGQEEKALDEAVFGAKVKVLGGPVKTPFGYYIYEVTKVIPGSQQALSRCSPQSRSRSPPKSSRRRSANSSRTSARSGRRAPNAATNTRCRTARPTRRRRRPPVPRRPRRSARFLTGATRAR